MIVQVDASKFAPSGVNRCSTSLTTIERKMPTRGRFRQTEASTPRRIASQRCLLNHIKIPDGFVVPFQIGNDMRAMLVHTSHEVALELRVSKRAPKAWKRSSLTNQLATRIATSIVQAQFTPKRGGFVATNAESDDETRSHILPVSQTHVSGRDATVKP